MSINIKNPKIGPDGKLIIPAKVDIDTTEATKVADKIRQNLDKVLGKGRFDISFIKEGLEYATKGLETLKDSFGKNDEKWIGFSSTITKAVANTLDEIEKIAEKNKVYSILEKSFGGGQKGLEGISEIFGGKQQSRLKLSAGIFGAASKLIPDLKKVMDGDKFMDSFTASLEGAANIMTNIKGIVGENAEGWLGWAANVTSAIATALPQMLALFGIQSSLAVAEQGKLPFPINIIAMAATVTGIATAIASLPNAKKMAAGGIAYGPTFAMVGEYAGASNNPEVIAPLNKLRSLIEPRDSYGSGQVEFKISGRELVGVLQKMNQVNQRTR